MTSLVAKFGILGMVALTAGCIPETDEDKQARLELVEDVYSTSIQTCDLEDDYKFNYMDYEARLRTVLDAQTKNALQFLVDNDVAVCLDDRLPKANNAFTKDVRALYYPANEPGGQRILALSDDGGYPDKLVISAISRFFLNYTSTQLDAMDEVQYAYRETFGNRLISWDEAPAFYNYRNGIDLEVSPIVETPEAP